MRDHDKSRPGGYGSVRRILIKVVEEDNHEKD